MFSKIAICIYMLLFVGVSTIIGKSFLECKHYRGVKAVNACTTIIAFVPLDSMKMSCLRMRAEKFGDMDKHQDAYNDYVSVIQLHEKMSEKKLSDNDVLSLCEKMAFFSDTLKKREEAFKYSDSAIKKGTKYPDIYRIRGEENLLRGNYSEAIEDLKKALSLGMDTVRVQFCLGRAYMFINKCDLASGYLKKVESGMKNDFDFNMVMGDLYYKLKQYNKSLGYHKAALHLNPSSSICMRIINKTELKIMNKFKRQKSNVFY